MSVPIPPEQASRFEAAKKELTKLPLLGPALWLFARDQRLRFTFIADLDWRLLPPLVLDQCRLYSKADMPWAFATWAFVNDAVDRRLGENPTAIGPHEWKCGTKPWLIDVVAPFGDVEQVAGEAAALCGSGQAVRAWLPAASGEPTLRSLAPRG